MTGVFVSAARPAYARNAKRGVSQPARGVGPRRTKQISHESTSSFFTAATTNTTYSTGGDAEAARAASSSSTTTVRRVLPNLLLPAPQEKQESSSTSLIGLVQRFVALRQAGHVQEAAAMLDPHVQVSYLGLPYIQSATVWGRLAVTSASAMAVDHHYAWQVLQTGAHATQVMRRGMEREGQRGSSRRSSREAVLEVFELHQSSDNNDNDHWVIGAMYLRRAPRQWTLWGSGGNKTKNPKKPKAKRSSNSRHLSLPSQRLTRDMLHGGDASSEQEYHATGNQYYQQQYYFDSSDDDGSADY